MLNFSRLWKVLQYLKILRLNHGAGSKYARNISQIAPLGMGHWAWGTGHGALGVGHWAWGTGCGAFSQPPTPHP